MSELSKPFILSLQLFDTKITIEIDHSDLTSDEAVQAVIGLLCAAGYSENLVKTTMQNVE